MQEFDALWDAAMKELSKTYSSTSMNLWFEDSRILSLDDSDVVIQVMDTQKKGVIEKRFLDPLSDCLKRLIGYPVHIHLRVKGDPDADVPTPPSFRRPDEPSAARAGTSGAGGTGGTGGAGNGSGSGGASGSGNDAGASGPGGEADDGEDGSGDSIRFHPGNEYTFENFIVGSSNKFAYAACTAVANAPSTDYNPLFIYSNSGLGKTHLLNAIMNQIHKNNPDFNIIYVKGEEFTNQMIESLSSKAAAEAFRHKYRRADILLIDDIQFIAGKEGTQEEFFHTFNALYEDGKQIIMTSDRPPRDIKKLEDRLRTRFEWGLIADIQPPDYELRMAIMQKKATMLGLYIPTEVLSYMAENLRSDIRQIEGAVKKLSARCYLSKEPITVDLARECISTIIRNEVSPTVTAEAIIAHVGHKYNVAVDDILGRQRNKPIARARNIAIFVIRRVTGLSQPLIGKMFERDHTTILNSLNAIEEEIRSNPLFEMEISDLIKEITE